MAKTKKSSLSSFDEALNDFGFNNPMTDNEVSNIDMLEDDDIDDQINNKLTSNNQDDDITEDNDGDNGNVDDDTNIPDNVLNNNDNLNQDVDGELNDTNDIDQNESEQIGAFFDAFAEELGWDVEDDEKPQSVEGLVDYIGKVIEENSTPKYSDDRIAQLDAYVRNGGKFEDFYRSQQESVSYENMDMENESNQKAAVREYLRYQGYSDDQINRKIERYEDGDMLEEEAEDAIARLRSIKEEQIAIQQQQQEQARQAQEAQAREFMDSLVNNINSLDNIRGISIPKADRKELFDYITKVDADGLTRYQKEFNKNLVTNLIESAYFTMKGDTLLGEATRNGRTSAANQLKKMLRHNSTNHSRYNVNDNKQRSVVDIASQFYK